MHLGAKDKEMIRIGSQNSSHGVSLIGACLFYLESTQGWVNYVRQIEVGHISPFSDPKMS